MSSRSKIDSLYVRGVGRFSRAMADVRPSRWFAILRQAHAGSLPIQCMCQPEHKAATMYVAKIASGYILKRSPGSGLAHHPQCVSHGETQTSTRAHGYQDPVVTQTAGGLINIALDAPLSLHTKERALPGAIQRVESGDHAKYRRTSNGLTILGFMEWLWERSGLQEWDASTEQRRLGSVYRCLNETLSDVRLGGLAGPDIVYIPDVRLDESTLAQKHKDLLSKYKVLQATAKPGQKPIMLLMGEVRSIFDTAHGAGIRIKGLGDESTVWLRDSLADDLARRFSAEIARFRSTAYATKQDEDGSMRLLVIIGVSVSETGKLNAQYAAFMSCSNQFIAVDSRHEARLAELLVRERRTFSKPLRYQAKTKDVHPDFWLLDAGPKPMAIEVFGMVTPACLDRKKTKLAHYQAHGTLLWQWDAIASPKIPLLPPIEPKG